VFSSFHPFVIPQQPCQNLPRIEQETGTTEEACRCSRHRRRSTLLTTTTPRNRGVLHHGTPARTIRPRETRTLAILASATTEVTPSPLPAQWKTSFLQSPPPQSWWPRVLHHGALKTKSNPRQSRRRNPLIKDNFQRFQLPQARWLYARSGAKRRWCKTALVGAAVVLPPPETAAIQGWQYNCHPNAAKLPPQRRCSYAERGNAIFPRRGSHGRHPGTFRPPSVECCFPGLRTES
jgi:hypothetical protein